MLSEEIIAINIKKFRKKSKMTLQNLADQSGLTKSYLSKIERKKQTPSFAALNRLAMVLGVDTTVLLTDNKDQLEDLRISFTKKSERKVIKPLDRLSHGDLYGYQYEALAFDKPGKNMEPIILSPNFEGNAIFQHEGEEFILVLEGEHEFNYDGEKYVMEEGDCVYFDAAVPHSGRSLGKRKAKVLIVMYNYKRL
ncbi:MAG: XRE family transcriptional regulator [Desulfatiglandaceae bacterium]